MSEELAPQLLEEAFLRYGLGAEAAESLCAAYNAYVERDFRATLPARQSAYAAMQEVLAQHGEVGVSREFWLVEDSMSSCRPWVVVRSRASLCEPLMHAVARAAARCPGFTAVVFSDESGDNSVEIAVGSNDG